MSSKKAVLDDDVAWPPGTVRLKTETKGDIVLVPQPTSDPNDPLNWSTRRKVVQMTLLAVYAIMMYGMATLSVPLWVEWNEDLGFSWDILNDSYGVSAITLSFGCLMFVPFALRFGRRPVYIISSSVMFATAVWSANMRTVGDLMGTNVLMGLSGSVNEALFQMTVSDLFFVHQRGTLNGVLLICGTIGNYFAPVAAGYCATSMGWRWAFWWSAIILGALIVAMIFCLEESKFLPSYTDGVVVPSSTREHRASLSEDPQRRLSAMGVDSVLVGELKNKHSPDLDETTPRRDTMASIVKYDTQQIDTKRLLPIDSSIPKRSIRERFAPYTYSSAIGYSWWRHLYQPFLMLAFFPTVAFAASTWAFCLSALSIVAVSQSDLLPYAPYNFSSAGVGLTNVPAAIGSILGTIVGGPIVDWYLIKQSKRNNGIYEPEFRLHLFGIPAAAMIIGIFMYGLTIAKGDPWIINFVGAGFVAFGIGGMGDIVLTCLQDSYLEILPDCLVGVAFVRNIIAVIFVFALGDWFDGMGVYNAFVLLGCLSILFVVPAIPLIIWGKRFRTKCAPRYRYYAAKQFTVRSM